MAIKLKDNESLALAGVLGVRAPDGSIARNVKLYEIVSDEEICPVSKMTEKEKAACDETVKFMAAQFHGYVSKVRGGSL